jgi:signal peptidase I
MNELALSLACVALLVTSLTTGAVAASKIATGDGASMEPTLCDGSLVIVDRTATPEVEDVVIAEWRDARLTHRIVGFDGRYVNLTGDNTDSLDYWRVDDSERRVEFVDNRGGEYARPLRSDVAGVVTSVLYDGCGPL